MTDPDKYLKPLDETLKSDELVKIDTDLAEAILSETIDKGAFKDVPILGSLIGILKTGVMVQNHLFLKKLVAFLTQLSDVPQEKRKKMIEAIDDSGEFRVKVGEKILFLIDKCDDNEKAELIAKLFKAFIDEKITYSDFVKASKIIENIHIEDLNWFLQNDYEQLDIDDGAGAFLNSGLFEINQISLKLKQTEDGTWDNSAGKHEIKGGKIMTHISYLGKKIRKILG